MPATAESTVRRQRRGMRRLQDQMPRWVDEGRLLLGIAPPQHEHDRLGLGVHLSNDPIGESLPAAIAMRSGTAHLHSQHTVEQQHALLRPMFEEAVPGRLYADVALKLLEDVDEAWRR